MRSPEKLTTAKAGILVAGAGLLLGTGLFMASCVPEPLPPHVEIDAVDLIDLEIRAIDVEIRVDVLEERGEAVAQALGAVQLLGPRLAAVEARTEAIEARVREASASLADASGDGALRPAARTPTATRATRKRSPACPIFTALGMAP